MQQALHTRDYASLHPDSEAELVAALVTPVPGERATGQFLRYEGTYDRIAEARREDDARLQPGVWEKDLKRADWVAAAQICGEALEQRSKDLQIAAWLMEAWCKLHGFAGADAGLRLINGLCEHYWPDLYPTLEDPEYRAAPFYWIEEKLSLQLKFIPLTRPSETVATMFSFADWESACADQQTRLQHPEMELSGELTPEGIETGLRQTAATVTAEERRRITGAEEEARRLDAFLEANCPAPAPSLRQFRATLSAVGEWLGERTATAPESEDVPPTAAATTAEATAPHAPTRPEAPPAGEPTAPAATGPIRSRAEAYQILGEVANYLLRIEPHSPTPYLIQRAIRWGNLPFDQLVRELVRDNGALIEVQQMLNLKP